MRVNFFFLLVTITLNAIGLFGAGAEPAPESLEPLDAAAVPDYAVRLVPLGQDSTGRAYLNVTVPDEPSADPVITLRGSILTPHELGAVDLDFEVHDRTTDTMDVNHLSVVPVEGATPFEFTWKVADSHDGEFLLRLVLTQRSGVTLAWAEWNAIKRSRSAVAAIRAAARTTIADTHIASERDEGAGPAWVAGQIRLAEDAVAAVEPVDAATLLRADANARFALGVVNRIRALDVFRPGLADSSKEAARLGGGAQLSARSGGFYLGNGPAYFVGLAGDGGAGGVRPSWEYGLNLTAITLDPAALNEPALAENLSAALRRANDAGVAAAVWVESNDPSKTVSAETVRRVAEIPNLLALSLWTQPYVKLDSIHVRPGFIDYVKSAYKDRYQLNREWKRYLLSYDEIDIWPDYSNPAYQYDWQTYRRSLVTKRLLTRAADIQAAAPGAPLTVTLTDALLKFGATRMGLDQAQLATQVPVASVQTSGGLDDPIFAQRYPEAQFLYTLRRAVAPATPLVALHRLNTAPGERYRRDLAADLRTLIVDSAMSGVAAQALSVPEMPDVVGEAPEIVEGLLAGAADVNRSGEFVAAWRQTPAPVAILWSDSSNIFNDGRGYLESVRRAFEGCSFAGHKLCFLTEQQLAEGALDGVKVLVLPDTPALSNAAFAALERLSQDSKDIGIVRTTETIAYDERGQPHGHVIAFGPEAVLLRGGDPPYAYLEALDEITARGYLPDIPRAVNASDYPLEGVKTAYLEMHGGPYLYILNLRKDPVACYLTRGIVGGTDLLTKNTLDFPRTIPPLTPMILRLSPAESTKPGETSELPGDTRVGEPGTAGPIVR